MTDADSEEVADILKNLVDDKDADSESKKNGMSTDSVTFNRGFRGRAIEGCQKNSTTTNPRRYGNEILDKIGYNSVFIRGISEMLESNRVFWRSSYQVMSV